jgi:hypothetical protein
MNTGRLRIVPPLPALETDIEVRAALPGGAVEELFAADELISAVGAIHDAAQEARPRCSGPAAEYADELVEEAEAAYVSLLRLRQVLARGWV